MAGLDLHWEVTVPGTRAAYEAFSPVLAPAGFYLAGGTALALYEGHRISVDLDFFAPSVGDPDLLARRFETSGIAFEAASTAPETLYGRVGDVHVSFIGLAYPLLAATVQPGPGLVPLASPDDIAAMKLAAVASRGSRKDFVDLWVLLTRRMALREALDRFRAKYATRDIGHVLESLVYFDDAEQEPALRLVAPIEWERVKADFRHWVGKLLP